MIVDLPGTLARERFGRPIEAIGRVLGVAMDKIENTVRAGPGTIDEVGPGHGTLGRHAGAEVAEAPRRAQLLEVGQQPIAHHGFRQSRVHAVDADYNNLLAGAARYPSRSAQEITPARHDGTGTSGEGSAL